MNHSHNKPRVDLGQTVATLGAIGLVQVLDISTPRL